MASGGREGEWLLLICERHRKLARIFAIKSQFRAKRVVSGPDGGSWHRVCCFACHLQLAEPAKTGHRQGDNLAGLC